MVKVDVVLLLLAVFARSTLQFSVDEQIKTLVKEWAPLIWISPDEEYYPSGVPYFLQNVHLANENGKIIMVSINETHFPQINTKSLFLVTKRNLDYLQNVGNSFLNGHNPNTHSVPAYVVIVPCTPNTAFHTSDKVKIQNDVINILYKQTKPELYFTATYWFFYPYNKGKKICALGSVPTLTLFGRCFGRLKTFGSHVGDWEHMTLNFRGETSPSEIYISIHDTGGYYELDPRKRYFKLNSQRRSRRVQKPKLPPVIQVEWGHPVLFAASGSHGLWPSPGVHEYLKIPYLTDNCGYGVPWKTWENLEMFVMGDGSLPKWLFFKGRWGNPKAKCVLFRKLGVCERTEGPEGILRNKQEFDCVDK